MVGKCPLCVVIPAVEGPQSGLVAATATSKTSQECGLWLHMCCRLGATFKQVWIVATYPLPPQGHSNHGAQGENTLILQPTSGRGSRYLVY